jgi:hypothetical protein
MELVHLLEHGDNVTEPIHDGKTQHFLMVHLYARTHDHEPDNRAHLAQ